MLGAFAKYWDKSGETRLPKYTKKFKFGGSVNTLTTLLEEMFTQPINMRGHQKCSPEGRYAVFEAKLRLNNKCDDFLDDEEKKQMDRRQEKSGMYYM